MAAWLEEFLIVLAHSKRTQLAIYMAVVSFFAILFVGKYMTDRLQLGGVFAPLAEAVRETLLGRYEKTAWVSLGSFLLLAVRLYLKDRKKFFEL